MKLLNRIWLILYNKLNRGNPYVRKEDHGDMEFQNYWSYFNNIEQKMSILLKNLITLQLCRKKEKDNVCLIHSALLSLCNRNWLCICDFIYSLQIFLILLAENFKKSQNQFGHELYAENSKNDLIIHKIRKYLKRHIKNKRRNSANSNRKLL